MKFALKIFKVKDKHSGAALHLEHKQSALIKYKKFNLDDAHKKTNLQDILPDFFVSTITSF